MEQKSNVQNRAEKEYKNSREKFHLLLREIISNSIQAVLIRKEKEKDAHNPYIPEITLEISYSDKQCSIGLRDNGEGFTKINTLCFDELDKKNIEKEKYHQSTIWRNSFLDYMTICMFQMTRMQN